MPLIALMYALLASTFLFAKYTLDYASPIFVIGFRMTLAGILLLSFVALMRRDQFKIARKDLPVFLRVSFFHIFLAFVAEFWALQYLSSSKTNLIYSLTPLIAATLSYFLLKERLSRIKVMGLCLGFAGLTPILLLQSENAPGGEFFHISIPEIVLLVAVTSAAYAWFDIKKLMQRGYHLILINGFAMLIGGVAAFILSFSIEGISPLPVKQFDMFLQFVLILILLSNVIFYNMYGYLLKKYSITFLTFAGFLCPIFGTFLGWFFRGEEITWHYWVSLSVIGCALFLFYREELKSTPVVIAEQ